MREKIINDLQHNIFGEGLLLFRNKTEAKTEANWFEEQGYDALVRHDPYYNVWEVIITKKASH